MIWLQFICLVEVGQSFLKVSEPGKDACPPAPDAVKDYSRAIQFAQYSVEQEPERQQFLNGLGAIQFRAGHYQQALKSLAVATSKKESADTSNAYSAYFQAMTEHHLNRPADARRSLAKANELAEVIGALEEQVHVRNENDRTGHGAGPSMP